MTNGSVNAVVGLHQSTDFTARSVVLRERLMHILTMSFVRQGMTDADAVDAATRLVFEMEQDASRFGPAPDPASPARRAYHPIQGPSGSISQPRGLRAPIIL